ncbi:lysine exporter LysO family protein [Candidatus Bipolaricaulota bacterium]|nr:lysine exporter LysO family protein [Candidatus Bipolaricaulota bacterium]
MELWMILLPLFLGIAIGYLDLWPGLLRKVDGPLSRVALLFLLTLMGTKIGSDSEILKNIGNIGFQSLLISAGSIVGSVTILKLISPLFSSFTDGTEGMDGVSPKLDLKLTLSIVAVLILGLFLGYSVIPETFIGTIDLTITYVLGLLLLAVGISLGLNKSIFNQVSGLGWRIVLLPISIAAGSIAGPLAISFFLQLTPIEAAAVGAGFGWYSLSAILLSKLHGPELGATAFLANIFREMLTFILLPLTARFIGKIVSIAPGGATTMDVTLPLLKEIWGEGIILPAFFSGAVLSSLVPLIVPLLIRI